MMNKEQLDRLYSSKYFPACEVMEWNAAYRRGYQAAMDGIKLIEDCRDDAAWLDGWRDGKKDIAGEDN